jgi:hypothetical protein|nr:MAG TPA: hypothetical protein [Caudoviricetes sp.]
MEKLKDLAEIKHDLIDAVKAELAQGIDKVDTAELGEVVDMIKDLASAEKDCIEAYSMQDEMDDGRMGYDRWRYASGRFAPKGRGRRGYDRMEPWPMGYDEERDGRMPRDPYKRMGFDGEPKERLEKVMDAMGEIWAAADPDVKAKMKTDVKDLLYQMEQAGA